MTLNHVKMMIMRPSTALSATLFSTPEIISLHQVHLCWPVHSSSLATKMSSQHTQPPQKRHSFAVLKTGHATDYTERTHGGYGRMLERLLRDENREEHWDIFSVIDGDFSFEGDAADSYDGFVITGSSADAHSQDVEWILRLCDNLRHLHQNKKKKLLGICFGHQILARALGGKTGRAKVGWELGLKRVDVNTKLVSQLYGGLDLTSPLNVIESHRDQVSCIPPGAVILASSEKTKVEMFALGDLVLGIQCHPEFSKDVVMDIIHSRLSSKTISSEIAIEAIESLERMQLDQEPLRVLCKTFLKGH